MIILHKHHIIPKHIGGSDDPTNLIELTIEQHAEAHKKLFEQHDRWQDRIAWLTLSGQIDGAEAARQKRIETNKARTGKIVVSEETRRKLRESSIKNGNAPPAKANSKSFKEGHISWNAGKKNCFSESSLYKMSQSRIGNTNSLGTKRTNNQKLNISRSRIGKGTGSSNGMASAENRKKVSLSKIGRKWFHNPETKQVICVSPNNIPFGFIPGKKIT